MEEEMSPQSSLNLLATVETAPLEPGSIAPVVPFWHNEVIRRLSTVWNTGLVRNDNAIEDVVEALVDLVSCLEMNQLVLYENINRQPGCHKPRMDI